MTNTIVFFGSEYPGELTIDSIIQLDQINSGIYSNHHPYWHTMLIKVFYDLGNNLLGDINAGVAAYSIFQVIVMALIEAYANMTLRQVGTKKIFNILFCLSFVLLPYNVIYSMTMWKDVLFGGIVLLFITCIVRIYFKLGTNYLNLLLLVISSIGFGLLRTNGFYALILMFIVFAIFFFKKYIKQIVLMFLCLVSVFILRGPLLSYLNVAQPDLIESLSIPCQQIARVIYDEKEISNNDINLLNQIIDVDKIPNSYKPYISDPIKNLVREKDNQNYLEKHIDDYLTLYIKLGISNPLEYIKAYIDQTKGYYNGGYDYWVIAMDVSENEYGIYRNNTQNFLHKNIVNYEKSFHKIPILNPFVSIGLHTWVILAVLYIGIINKSSETIIISIPPLAIIATLLIATPVFSEFRYAA